MNIIFAPHLDDEIIGCYSILDIIDKIVYFTNDYRINAIKDNNKYVYFDNFNFEDILETDTIYIPSKYDYHPKHRQVRNFGIGLNCNKMFYSVEMNVHWLEEEDDSKSKKKMFDQLYPNEDMKNDKYFLFKSIKSYDDIEFDIYKRFDYELYISIHPLINKDDLKRIDFTVNIPDVLYNRLQSIFPNNIIELKYTHLFKNKIIK